MNPTRLRFAVAAFITVFMCVGSAGFSQSIGSWVYSQRRDAITDDDTSMVFARAAEYPRFADGAALVIRCSRGSPNGVSVFFGADRYLGSADRVPVAYRIGSEAAIESQWNASVSNEAVFVPAGEQASFLAAVRRNPRLVIRISAFRESYTYVVDTAGLGGALTRLTCYTGS